MAKLPPKPRKAASQDVNKEFEERSSMIEEKVGSGKPGMFWIASVIQYQLAVQSQKIRKISEEEPLIQLNLLLAGKILHAHEGHGKVGLHADPLAVLAEPFQLMAAKPLG